MKIIYSPSVSFRFSFILTFAILRMSGNGSGWSIGNWVVPFPVLYVDSSLIDASMSDVVG
jgi:hypothetical protein